MNTNMKRKLMEYGEYNLDLKKHIMSKSPQYEELRKQIEQDEKEIDRLELILT